MANIEEAIIDFLEKGTVEAQSCKICCPACDLYVLASVETFIKLAELLEWTVIGENPIGATSCSTDCSFQPCYQELIDKLELDSADIDRLLDKGIVETGSIGINNEGDTYLCVLADFVLSAYNLREDDTITKIDLLLTILDLGIVIYCNQENGQFVTGSQETFAKYYEAMVDEQFTKRCCDNVKASVETYLKYAEAVGLTKPVPEI